jgi:hypothetical protein
VAGKFEADINSRRRDAKKLARQTESAFERRESLAPWFAKLHRAKSAVG